MKAINPILIGLVCLFSVSAVAQKMVPHSFRHQANPSDRDQLRFLTQVTQPNTTFLRLYFKGTQLGEGSYLVLEGTDGTRQELRKQDLENWHYSSAYFNGQSVNVSLFAAVGDRNTVIISGLKISSESTSLTNKARPAAETQPAARQAAAGASSVTYPYAKAVGRFTNGSDSFGTGWIAPNGAIVTSWSIYLDKVANGYDLIEFNVPPSVGTTVQHPGPEDQYPLAVLNPGNLEFHMLAFKNGDDPYSAGWALLEALPNSTGMRPGERQQEFFRIATNPGNFTIDAKGEGGVPVGISHYAHLPGDSYNGLFRTLRLLQTSLLPQNTHLSTLGTDGNRDRYVLYNASALLGLLPDRTIGSDAGAPITYEESGFAIGVHNYSLHDLPSVGFGFRDDDFRNNVATFFSTNVAYVDFDGLYDPSTGEIHKPHLTANKAASDAPSGSQVYFARGTYPGAATFNRPMTLRAPVGKVVIGSSNGGARKGSESSIARNMAMTEALGAHSRLESPETAEKVRAFPNPFREQTEIKYPFAEGVPVSVRIFNMAGVPVAAFTPNNTVSGQNGVQWNGTDQNGMSVPAGLYLVKVNYGNQTFTTKVLKK